MLALKEQQHEKANGSPHVWRQSGSATDFTGEHRILFIQKVCSGNS